VQINGGRLDGEDIAAGPASQLHTVESAQGLAQAGQVAVDRAGDAARRLVAPDPVGELIDRHQLVRVHEKNREHGAPPGVTEVDRLAVHQRFD
jgi:hypothetical protein